MGTIICRGFPPVFSAIFLVYCIFLDSSFGVETKNTICKQALSAISSPTASYTLKDWVQAYKKSKQDGNIAGGAFALSQILLLKKNELGISLRTKIALRAFGHALESARITEYTPKDSTYFDTYDSLGNRKSYPHRTAQFLKRWGVHGLWAMGPFLFRLVPNYILRFILSGKMTHEVNDILKNNSQNFQEWGIEDDLYLKIINTEYFSMPARSRKYFKRYQRGILYGPVVMMNLMLWSSFAMDTPIYPPKLIADQFHPKYTNSDYYADVKRELGLDLSNKKIAYFYDIEMLHGIKDYPLGNALISEFNPKYFPLASKIKKDVGHGEFRAIGVKNFHDLFTKLSWNTDADVVFFDFHGSPQNISLGGERLSDYSQYTDPSKVQKHRFKENTPFIFFGCGTGDENKNFNLVNSPIIWLSKQYAPEGKIIASLNTNLFYATVLNPEKSFSHNLGLNLVGAAFGTISKTVQQATTGPSEYLNEIDKMEGRVFGVKKGFVIIDVQTGHRKFVYEESERTSSR